MSFDALTYAGLFSAAVSGGFLIALVTHTGINRIRGHLPTRSNNPRATDTGR
jgi:hypothetical protein